jgi:hypothetical protein
MAEYTEFYRPDFLPTFFGPGGPSRLWIYTLRATETTIYQGSYLDQARELFGGSSSGGSIITPPSGGGGGGGATDLDYLGDYAPATYNDGDIVIADDGIAYICVKAGVTTPPEPWPGVGVWASGGDMGPVSVWLGGSRQFAVGPNPATWVPVPEYVRFHSAAAYTGKLYVELWARFSGVGVQARLFNLTDSVATAITEVVISNTPVLAVLPVTVEPQKVYRLEVLPSLPGEDVFALGTIGD